MGCWFEPSAFITQISHRPVRSVRKAIWEPSDDQAGVNRVDQHPPSPRIHRQRGRLLLYQFVGQPQLLPRPLTQTHLAG